MKAKIKDSNNIAEYGSSWRFRSSPLVEAMVQRYIKAKGGKRPTLVNYAILSALFSEEGFKLPPMSPAKQKAFLAFVDQAWRECKDERQVRKLITEDFLHGA